MSTPTPTRVAVVDVGTNSTRLLVAEVAGGRVTAQLERRTEVTRLGEGVDGSKLLAPQAMDRVFAAVGRYRERIDALEPDHAVAVLTSAVRDAANGGAFAAQIAERFRLDARVIDGEEEARLTYLGATSERDPADRTPLLVVDIGGGSTEVIVGHGHEPSFHASLQAGIVRQTERHLPTDPPRPEDLDALRREIHGLLREHVPERVRAEPAAGIAVAGTPTSLAAIDMRLERYDPDRVHGHVLARTTCEALLARLARMSLPERLEVAGLHPDRAPMIVAGTAILAEVLDAFDLERIDVSEHDILRGAALDRAGWSRADRPDA